MLRVPVPNLFLTDLGRLHPHDRTIGGRSGLGVAAPRRAAAHRSAEAPPAGP